MPHPLQVPERRRCGQQVAARKVRLHRKLARLHVLDRLVRQDLVGAALLVEEAEPRVEVRVGGRQEQAVVGRLDEGLLAVLGDPDHRPRHADAARVTEALRGPHGDEERHLVARAQEQAVGHQLVVDAVEAHEARLVQLLVEVAVDVLRTLLDVRLLEHEGRFGPELRGREARGPLLNVLDRRHGPVRLDVPGRAGVHPDQRQRVVDPEPVYDAAAAVVERVQQRAGLASYSHGDRQAVHELGSRSNAVHGRLRHPGGVHTPRLADFGSRHVVLRFEACAEDRDLVAA
mmetsp:Transcript_37272/g.87714  ORF Transcript_37272/g.87714 Transcript_37272/m.87714 type:complete len:288 (-) Transcript_37272:430-1293(-)